MQGMIVSKPYRYARKEKASVINGYFGFSFKTL